MHIHEILNMPIEDYEVERRRLEVLFAGKTGQHMTPNDPVCRTPTTLMGYLADVFLHSRIRGTATDIQDFFSSLAPRWRKPSLEGLLLYCEILANLLTEFSDKVSRHSDVNALSTQIYENIMIILDKTGHRLHERENGVLEILKKNVLAATVVEDLTDADTARAVLEYTHYGLKGKLEKKRELLVAIGRHVEPILDDSKMKEFCNWLLDDVSSCLNNLHIRHNNEEGKKKNDLVGEMNAQELETIYDETYRAMLLLIEMQKHRCVHEKIKAMHKHLEELRAAKGGGNAEGGLRRTRRSAEAEGEARDRGDDAGAGRGREETEGE